MINLFGITVEAPSLSAGLYYEDLLSSIAKRSSEREVLQFFLTPHLPEIISETQNELDNIDVSQCRPQAISFYLSQLKSTGVYENMVLKTIASDHQFSSARTASEILKGKQPSLPSTFPGDHKKAESLVVGTVSSSVGDQECRQYLHRQLIKSRIQDIAKDLFYAVNHGLNPEQSVRFMSILYDLSKLKTAEFTNYSQIKENIVNSILTDEPINLIHIKCLRFTYPQGCHLCLLEHTGSDKDPNNFSRRPQDERPIFEKLRQTKLIFEQNGLTVNLNILVSDQDLIDYFPLGGEGVIPDSDLTKARESLNKYLNAVSEAAPFANVQFLRSFFKEHNLLFSFESSRDNIVSQLKRGNSTIGEGYIESKVNYRFESNSKIFTTRPSRDFARIRVYSQVGSLQALSVLGQRNILIEEDHGNDNQFIGGYRHTALPVVFVNLKN